MDKQIEFLKYLRKNDAEVKEKNINSVLQKLKLYDEDKSFEFLKGLKKIGYIEWRDGRPMRIWDDPNILGRSPDAAAPLDYWAEITLPGLQYLREDELKIYNKWITIFAVVVALITASIGWYYSNSAKDKDEEISELKAERANILALQNTRPDSIKSLKFNLSLVRRSFADHLKSDSLAAVKPAPVHR